MRIQVPIRYQASGKKAGNRIASTLPFQERIDLELEVTDASSAPVVASWDDTAPENLEYRRSWGVSHGPDEHVRFYDGHYWRSIRRYEMAKEMEPLAPGATFAQINAHSREENARMDRADVTTVGLAEFIAAAEAGTMRGVVPLQEDLTSRKFKPAEDYFAEMNWSERERVAGPIREAVRSVIAVDGDMFVRCHEPSGMVALASFSFRDRGDNMVRYGDVLKVTTRLEEDGRSKEVQLFPLQRFKNALTAARRANATNRHMKEHLDRLNASREPRLYGEYYSDPGNVAVSEAGGHLRRFLALVREGGIALEETAKLRLYCDLVDACNNWPSEDSITLLEEAGAEWLVRFAEAREWQSPSLRAIRAAVEAASARPMGLPGLGTGLSNLP